MTYRTRGQHRHGEIVCYHGRSFEMASAAWDAAGGWALARYVDRLEPEGWWHAIIAYEDRVAMEHGERGEN